MPWECKIAMGLMRSTHNLLGELSVSSLSLSKLTNLQEQILAKQTQQQKNMKFSTFALVGLVPQLSLATNLRESASRIRNFADKDSVGSFNGEYARFFKMVAENPVLTLEDLMDSQQALETELDVEQAEIKAFMAAIQRSEIINLSMDISNAPSDSKSPSASDNPSVSPTVSSMPTMKVGDPTAAPSSFPSAIPTTTPSNSPSTTAPTTEPPTMVPTFAGCGFSAESRVQAILSILDAVADPVLIRDGTSSQGLATQWLIEDDEFRICPDDDKLIQRWSMAVMYFSTGGPDWFQCSGDEAATDICGAEDPFVGKQRFLSGVSECDWAGISCITGCVSEVEFGTCKVEEATKLLFAVHWCLSTPTLVYSLWRRFARFFVRIEQFGGYDPDRNGSLDRFGCLGDGTWWTDWSYSHRNWHSHQSHLFGLGL